MQNSDEIRRENENPCPSALIARSQRVRAKRGPMTGSATRPSRVVCVALDCRVALLLAMTGAR